MLKELGLCRGCALAALPRETTALQGRFHSSFLCRCNCEESIKRGKQAGSETGVALTDSAHITARTEFLQLRVLCGCCYITAHLTLSHLMGHGRASVWMEGRGGALNIT